MAFPGAPNLHRASSSDSSGRREVESLDISEDSKASKSNARDGVGTVVVIATAAVTPRNMLLSASLLSNALALPLALVLKQLQRLELVRATISVAMERRRVMVKSIVLIVVLPYHEL